MSASGLLQKLIIMLLEEMPEYRRQAEGFAQDEASRRRLLRSLMNVRPPMPLSPDFLALQDKWLAAEREARGVVDAAALPVTAAYPRLAIWRGDITRLCADAVVNAANSSLLGCFFPCHGCIDNAIHSSAGLQLRDACSRIMRAQGHPEPAGRARLTPGFNLPARYVLHTVGPIESGDATAKNREELACCYRSCLELAGEEKLETVAFCCISTGEFHFPNRQAAEIAVNTVTGFLRCDTSLKKVIFNVFKAEDEAIYRRLLGADRAAPAGT